jgi:hypothetical protein
MKAPKIYSIYNRPTSLIPHDFPDGLTEQHHAESCDYGASKSAKVSQQNAREQRAWQTQMSNTAHTREIVDLRNAGLNRSKCTNKLKPTSKENERIIKVSEGRNIEH